MTQIDLKPKTFLNPETLLREVGLTPGMTVADFGCGNGFYAVAAGSMVGKKGQVYAVDILEEALSQTTILDIGRKLGRKAPAGFSGSGAVEISAV